MSFSEPTNLNEAIEFLELAYQEANDYDQKFSDAFSNDPTDPNDDPYVAQASSESRSAWGIYQHAKLTVESFGGHIGYVTNTNDYTSMIVITDSAGTELLTYKL